MGSLLGRRLNWLYALFDLKDPEIPNQLATGDITPVVDAAALGWGYGTPLQFQTFILAGAGVGYVTLIDGTAEPVGHHLVLAWYVNNLPGAAGNHNGWLSLRAPLAAVGTWPLHNRMSVPAGTFEAFSELGQAVAGAYLVPAGFDLLWQHEGQPAGADCDIGGVFFRLPAGAKVL